MNGMISYLFTFITEPQVIWNRGKFGFQAVDVKCVAAFIAHGHELPSAVLVTLAATLK